MAGLTLTLTLASTSPHSPPPPAHSLLPPTHNNTSQIIDDYRSAALGGAVTAATKRTGFSTFPPYLVLTVQRCGGKGILHAVFYRTHACI